MHNVGSKAVLHSGPQLYLAQSSWVSHPRGHKGCPLYASAGLVPGFCYLCTMSLISFTELRSLLKS